MTISYEETGLRYDALVNALETGEIETVRALRKHGLTPRTEAGATAVPRAKLFHDDLDCHWIPDSLDDARLCAVAMVAGLRAGRWEALRAAAQAGCDTSCPRLESRWYRSAAAVPGGFEFLGSLADDGRFHPTLAGAVHSDSPEAVRFAVSRGAHPDTRDEDGDPLLFETIRAPWLRHDGAFAGLLACGASPRATDADGKTAVHLAARSHRPEMLLALLKSGGRADTADEDGVTPLAEAFAIHRSVASMPEVVWEMRPFLPCVELLLASGVSPKVRLPEGGSGLTAVAASGTAKQVRGLLALGFDPAEYDEHGYTPLQVALRKDNPGTFAVLAARSPEAADRLVFAHDWSARTDGVFEGSILGELSWDAPRWRVFLRGRTFSPRRLAALLKNPSLPGEMRLALIRDGL